MGLPSKLRSLWKAARYHYIPPSFLPALVGFAAAWSATGELHVPSIVLTLVALVLNHAALNMTDDYFDYLHAVDRAKQGSVNPYAGGSRTLTSGELTSREMLAAFLVLYAATAVIGLYLAWTRGWAVLVFGAIGVACSLFYTAPPVKYAYRGFGELSLLLNFSLTIGLGAFYVQARSLSLEAAAAVLPLGFMMFSMIVINEIPDEEDDRAGGKRNLVVRFGPLNAWRMFAASTAAAYVAIVLGVALHVVSWWTCLALLTVPWAVQAIVVMKRKLAEPVALAPANLATIRAHNVMGILLVLAYVLQGGSQRSGVAAPALLLFATAVLYGPVAAVIFGGPPMPPLRASRA